MYSYGPVLLILEILFIIHVIRNGHDRVWIFLILFFPIVGCAVYFFMIILPGLQSGKAVEGIARKLDPTRKLNKHMDDLRSTDSLYNRMNLADELVQQGQYDEAIKLYKESLSGVFSDDTELLFGLARALFDAGRHEESLETMDRLIELTGSRLKSERRMLKAMSLEILARNKEAEDEYEEVVPGFTGPEAKCRFAMFLINTGQQERGSKLFAEVVDNARRSPHHYRKLHKDWIKVAKKHSA